MKRIISILICISVVLSVGSISVFADMPLYLKSNYLDYNYDINNYGIIINNTKFLLNEQGVLNKIELTTGNDEVLLYDVISFVTNGENLYYTSRNKKGIYRYNLPLKTEESVYDEDVSGVVGCWQDRYLYYSEIKNDYDFPYTWVLDMETGVTKEISACTESLYPFNGKLYYSLFNGDLPYSVLYISELDGSNRQVLIESICSCGFEIIDNQIYYGKYFQDEYSYQLMKCDLSGENNQILSRKLIDNDLLGMDNSFFYYSDFREYDDENNGYKEAHTVSKIPYGTPFFEYPKSNIAVTINNRIIEFDQQPIIVNGRTLVPLRKIFEELGATVEWDEDTQSITAKRNNKTIQLTINSADILVNDNLIILDTPAIIVNNRTLVPVRAVSEAFDCTVTWNDYLNWVTINTPDKEELNYSSYIGKWHMDSPYMGNDVLLNILNISNNKTVEFTLGGYFSNYGNKVLTAEIEDNRFKLPTPEFDGEPSDLTFTFYNGFIYLEDCLRAEWCPYIILVQ